MTRRSFFSLWMATLLGKMWPGKIEPARSFQTLSARPRLNPTLISIRAASSTSYPGQILRYSPNDHFIVMPQEDETPA